MFTVLMFIDENGREQFFLVFIDEEPELFFRELNHNFEDSATVTVDLTDYTRN